jgi:WD40 repeat protein
LWDVQNLAVEPLVFKGHSGDVQQVLFSPDDHWLVTGSNDQTIRIWNLNLGELLGKACQLASRNLTKLEWEIYFPGEPYRKTCEQWQ